VNGPATDVNEFVGGSVWGVKSAESGLEKSPQLLRLRCPCGPVARLGL